MKWACFWVTLTCKQCRQNMWDGKSSQEQWQPLLQQSLHSHYSECHEASGSPACIGTPRSSWRNHLGPGHNHTLNVNTRTEKSEIRIISLMRSYSLEWNLKHNVETHHLQNKWHLVWLSLSFVTQLSSHTSAPLLHWDLHILAASKHKVRGLMLILDNVSEDKGV